MIPIVFENAHFIVVEKPAGYLSVASRLGARDPRPCLSAELARSFENALPVHRLDVEVSGVMLFAKGAAAHREANGWFERREVRKIYEAWSERPADPVEMRHDRELRWESCLLRGKRRTYESPNGKAAVTIARWRGSNEYRGVPVDDWWLEPKTGRPHQLRYELAKYGAPILGDALYGAKRGFVDGAIALRAVKLDFETCATADKLGLPKEVTVKGLAEVYS